MKGKATVNVRRMLCLLVGLSGLLWVPSATAATGPAPAWQIHVTPYPTAFAPGAIGDSQDGPGYLVVATNVGGAPTSGKFTISQKLPANLSPSVEAKPEGFYGAELSHKPLTCSASTKTITCSGAEPLYPGQQAVVIVALDVGTKASGTLNTEAGVEGGNEGSAKGREGSVQGAGTRREIEPEGRQADRQQRDEDGDGRAAGGAGRWR